MTIRRLFVANRGEIAMRILRACRDLGIESVLGYSEADRESLPVSTADRAVCIGGAKAASSYLDASRILAAATGTGCDAIHPGYGFLSENEAFSQACQEHGQIFVGPDPETIALLGNKIAGRRAAQEAGVPVMNGTAAPVTDLASATEQAREMGYPVLIKAAGGGGGKGMRKVEHPDDLGRMLALATSEASASSGVADVYLERFITRARHVEIQVAADRHGGTVHFGERDCSIQRNYQKLVEESPSPGITPQTRERLASAAVALLEHVGYLGVGTVEFLVDQDTQEFFFIEVNTRLQVEHPVTELVTGHDLVALQIRIAAGENIGIEQKEIVPRGHAIEFRINAEDTTQNFRPGAGTLKTWHVPQGPWVRADTHCYQGYEVPPFYDSLLAKIIVHGLDRDSVLARSRRVLDELAVDGIPTNLPFHRWLVRHDDFCTGEIDTEWTSRKWLEGM